jgi:hypothetical protein
LRTHVSHPYTTTGLITVISRLVGNILPVSKIYARFQASAAMCLSSAGFWDLTPHRMVIPCRCFRATYQSRLEVSSSRRRSFDTWKWDLFVVPKRRYGINDLRSVKSRKSAERISDLQESMTPPLWNGLFCQITSLIFPILTWATHYLFLVPNDLLVCDIFVPALMNICEVGLVVVSIKS